MITENTVKEITKAIINTVKPAKVILFGSYARGNAGTDSDLDFLVIEDLPFGPGGSRRKESTMLWEILASFSVAKDILVYSSDEVSMWQNTRNHIIARALREGRVLYERS